MPGWLFYLVAISPGMLAGLAGLSPYYVCMLLLQWMPMNYNRIKMVG
jgi:hypothetical protein